MHNMKKKEWHIVSWSQEEDDILREQIRIHGTENWAMIASKFVDKTTRQCRRRWFTYLSSDFKTGGWSPEEDMLLCEAQKIYGNRWTEIAKVVSGRTDNAVKNRFTTLCKKRAKREALAKENRTSYVNLNNKRVIFSTGLSSDVVTPSTAPLKKTRTTYDSNQTETCNHGEKLLRECGTASHLLRPPFAVLNQNFHNSKGDFSIQLRVNHIKEAMVDGTAINRSHGTFLKKDDPKMLALMQQAELLSSLAIKVNSENTDQSLENAWKVLQDFLKQTKECDLLRFGFADTDFQIEDLKELLEDLRSSNEGSRPSRQTDPYEVSLTSSENSTGSTLPSRASSGDKSEPCQADLCSNPETSPESQSNELNASCCLADDNGKSYGASMNEVDNLLTCDEIKTDNGVVNEYSITEFSSPVQVTPFFRSLAAAIPSPKFSESEKHFLMKTLGMESASPSPCTNPSKPPTCKRSLLHCL
ncbi:myb domain protein [Abeliophyllum distichum]|uniref:Myb domain protein n=1 Tax=Abeliophyllum distichum TaxID=126358 RepID=A0ABD1NV88_9LAMI